VKDERDYLLYACLHNFVIPDLIEPAPYLIRGNPEQIPAFAGTAPGFPPLPLRERHNQKRGSVPIFFTEKGSKDRVVYLSENTSAALAEYLKKRGVLKVKRMFLVQKGPMKGKPISVRGIQKRMEHYAKKSAIEVSCHQLRHTMATQLLNADADLVAIQDLLGHSRIATTQRYCRVSNLKVQRDYYKAIEVVLQRTLPRRENEFEFK
jgi:hypothetical protein